VIVSPGWARSAAAEIVRNIPDGEPLFPSFPFLETWYSLPLGAMANALPSMLAKAQMAESAPMNFLLVSMVLVLQSSVDSRNLVNQY
jgi:hypothetical protein